MTNEAHYSTEWGIAEYEPPASAYIVELNRYHASALISAARSAAAVPGTSRAEIDLLTDAANSLIQQTVNL
jgi:hypothetical protein